ncbi:clavata3-like [Striga asiatica]|uniref:Clavata3-like n=1 Tax=Striga asiatica TaxID=4170 RepID=A0A5A7P1W0_STRAF|nr:clavata3-like [Striga asiatica]
MLFFIANASPAVITLPAKRIPCFTFLSLMVSIGAEKKGGLKRKESRKVPVLAVFFPARSAMAAPKEWPASHTPDELPKVAMTWRTACMAVSKRDPISDDVDVELEVARERVPFGDGAAEGNDVAGGRGVVVGEAEDGAEYGGVGVVDELAVQLEAEGFEPRRGEGVGPGPVCLTVAFKDVDGLDKAGRDRPPVVGIRPVLGEEIDYRWLLRNPKDQQFPFRIP